MNLYKKGIKDYIIVAFHLIRKIGPFRFKGKLQWTIGLNNDLAKKHYSKEGSKYTPT